MSLAGVPYERLAVVCGLERRPSRGPDGSVLLSSPTDERFWERELGEAVRAHFSGQSRRPPILRGTLHFSLSRPPPDLVEPLGPPTFRYGLAHAVVSPLQSVVAGHGPPLNLSIEDSFWAGVPGSRLRLSPAVIVRPGDGELDPGAIEGRSGPDAVYRSGFTESTAAAAFSSRPDFLEAVDAELRAAGFHPQSVRNVLESACRGDFPSGPAEGSAPHAGAVFAACARVSMRAALATACAACGCAYHEASGRLWAGFDAGGQFRDVAKLAVRLGCLSRPYDMTPHGQLEEKLQEGADPTADPDFTETLAALDAPTLEHLGAVLGSDAFQRHRELFQIHDHIAAVVDGAVAPASFSSSGLRASLGCDYLAALVRREIVDRGGEALIAAIASRNVVALPVSAFAAHPEILRALATLPVARASLLYRRTRRVQEQLRRDLHADEKDLPPALAQTVREAHDSLEFGRRASGADLIRRDPGMAVEVGADRRDLLSDKASELPAVIRDCGPKPVGVKEEKSTKSETKRDQALAALGRMWEKGGIARDLVAPPKAGIGKKGSGGILGNED